MAETAYELFQPRIRPVKALNALAGFLRNKENTREVFRLIAALDGVPAERNFQAFKASPVGVRILGEKLDLKDALMNRDALAALPAGSLGRDYFDFVTREGLSADGFQQEMDATGERFSRAGEDRRRFIYRLRHSHDLFHVLTGYGRDFIGELALLAFTRQHNNSRAFIFLILAGYFKARRDYPGMPVWACIREGAQLGRAANNMVNADWESLLVKPTSVVRRELNIGAPRRYLAIQSGAELLDRRYREDLSAGTVRQSS